MTTGKKIDDLELGALATEVLDLWQEHLASYAVDPKAKAELARLMVPAGQMFAEWAKVMQHSPYGTGATFKYQGTGFHSQSEPKEAPSYNQAAGSKTARTASNDGVISLTQLAGRMAEFEKRLTELEAQLAGTTKSSTRKKHKSGS